MNVQITIRGRQYTVRSDEAEEDIEAVARFVDRIGIENVKDALC